MPNAPDMKKKRKTPEQYSQQPAEADNCQCLFAKNYARFTAAGDEQTSADDRTDHHRKNNAANSNEKAPTEAVRRGLHPWCRPGRRSLVS